MKCQQHLLCLLFLWQHEIVSHSLSVPANLQAYLIWRRGSVCMLTTFDKHGPSFQQPTSKEDISEMNMTLGESSEKDAWLLNLIPSFTQWLKYSKRVISSCWFVAFRFKMPMETKGTCEEQQEHWKAIPKESQEGILSNSLHMRYVEVLGILVRWILISIIKPIPPIPAQPCRWGTREWNDLSRC